MLSREQRAYDQWVTREPPWSDPDWGAQPRCEVCGCWLRDKADSTEDFEDKVHCDGTVGEEYGAACGKLQAHAPHDEVMWAWVRVHRICKNCGHDNWEEG